MKQLFATLGIVLLLAVACAQGEQNGPGGPDAATNGADARPSNFPDANMSLPDARIMADARQFPDAAPPSDAAGDGTCTVDSDCGAGGCCLIIACFPIPGPCTP